MSHNVITKPVLVSAEPNTALSPPPESGAHPMEIYISYVLRIGVLVSAAIIFVGSALYVAGLGSNVGNPKKLNDILGGGGHSIPVSPVGIFHGITAGNPISIIQLGLLVLILTPMTRVGMTAILFMAQRDRVFIAITSVVFIVLLFGLIGFGS